MLLVSYFVNQRIIWTSSNNLSRFIPLDMSDITSNLTCTNYNVTTWEIHESCNMVSRHNWCTSLVVWASIAYIVNLRNSKIPMYVNVCMIPTFALCWGIQTNSAARSRVKTTLPFVFDWFAMSTLLYVQKYVQ